MSPSASPTSPALRPWQRLAVRLAAIFVLLTLATVGVVGFLVHQRQSREVEDTLGTQLLNIARVSALLVDPAAHAEAARAGRADAPAYRRVIKALAAIREETLLTTPMRTLAGYDPVSRRARIVVTTADDERPGETVTVGPEAADAVAWTFEDGVARYTGIYLTRGGKRISAFAPVLDARGRVAAVLQVDYPVDFYVDRLRELDTTIALGSLAGVLLAVFLAVVIARRVTRPMVALTTAAGRVAAGASVDRHVHYLYRRLRRCRRLDPVSERLSIRRGRRRKAGEVLRHPRRAFRQPGRMGQQRGRHRRGIDGRRMVDVLGHLTKAAVEILRHAIEYDAAELLLNRAGTAQPFDLHRRELDVASPRYAAANRFDVPLGETEVFDIAEPRWRRETSEALHVFGLPQTFGMRHGIDERGRIRRDDAGEEDHDLGAAPRESP
jgi:hypothetical protein